MKLLLILLLVTFYSCEDKLQQNQQTTTIQGAKVQASNTSNSIVEENDACICTKDWRPVCGENGVTYPNACQAKCEKVENFTEGTCQN